jgi:type I restriction enzyme S subunit
MTEVGVIPEDWRVSTVGEEFDIQLGKMLDSENNIGLLKPYLGNKSVQWGFIDITDLPRMAMSRSDLVRYRLKFGDLLVCEGGDVGRGAIWDSKLDECYYQKALHRLRPINGFNTRLMLEMLKFWSHHDLLSNYVTKTSIAHLTREKFELVPLAVPLKSEQHAIAVALSDMDALISGLDQLIVKKRDIKQATMQRLLAGQQRLPGFSGEWKTHSFGDLVERLEAGVSVNSVDESLRQHGHVQSILKTSAVSNGKFLPFECKKIAPVDLNRATASPLSNTILISRMNTPDLVGESGYVEKDYPWLFLPDRLWMAHFRKESDLNVKWLSYVISSPEYKSIIRSAATGTSGSMKNISKGTLLSLNILLPSGAEQTAIATILSDMDSELAILETRRDKAGQLKQGMMQELLTGRIRLPNSVSRG